ncbi:type I polyketide synthase [Actinomadura macrotermitis]|uniref:Narbonolide/10-deoxymethynolide synthase PikA1, modules 1 and 2 n=1 Tax=Actinomadura macrotermitis TaxID=2585200 RepID=A0A7K0CAB9_9ACTN|nr:type I polyketide synthase [Actinomadura macrotermitis]MQY09704.1 Narbonolide/10-deoxymethynolide synthase PikA1, modules 1 and 2 [Actinomadura macrotermitis]
MIGYEETVLDHDTPASWPPAGVQEIDTADLYSRLDARGFAYGPAFRGLRAAWRGGDDIYAEVDLATAQPATGPSYVMHPALFDSALHAALAPVLDREDGVFLPFILRDVRVHAPAARSLRVRLSATGEDTLSLSATDESGAAVASIGSLALHRVDTRELTATGQSSRLLRLAWKRCRLSPAGADGGRWAHLGTDHLGLTGALKAAGRQMGAYSSLHALDAGLRGGDPAPDVFIVSCTDEGGESGAGAAVRTAVQRALVLVQEMAADDRLAGSRLVVVTRGAVAAAQDEGCPDLAGAAVWGLIRSAQTEYPGRFALIDVDDEESSEQAVLAAVATGEPQLAVRRGALLRPRLTRGRPAARNAERAAGRWNPDGTVMITGGTGALGALIARHLVRRRGVRHLLLLSRKGPAAQGAAELVEELTALGAEVRVAAGDAADLADLGRAVAGLPAAHPLTAVVHSAGVVADCTLAALTPRRLQQVLRPKVDAVLALHELTKDLPDCDLVLFSSVSGLFGGAGQANYAAANAFLDAMAHRRRALGLRAVSLAWGLWESGDGMGGGLGSADLQRISRLGLAAMTAEEGLALLDASIARPEALLVPVKLDDAALREGGPSLPALLLDLVPDSAAGRRSDAGRDDAEALRELLARLPDEEREQAVVAFVCAQAAVVLGHQGAEAVDPEQELAAVGFDSLTNLELIRRLASATGLRLPATLAFDHPTPLQLGRHLRRLLQ